MDGGPTTGETGDLSAPSTLCSTVKSRQRSFVGGVWVDTHPMTSSGGPDSGCSASTRERSNRLSPKKSASPFLCSAEWCSTGYPKSVPANPNLDLVCALVALPVPQSVSPVS